MQELLFDPAVWMPVTAMLIAAGLFVYGNNRVKASIRNAGLAAALLVVAWVGVAYFVQTPSEKCVTRTRAILASVEAGDWAKLRTLLDPNTALEQLLGRERIATVTEQAASSFQVKTIRVLSTENVKGSGTIDVSLSTLIEGVSPVTGSWRFEYESRRGDIVLTRIVPIAIGPAGSDQIRRQIGVR